jgi:hypothetical protein
MIVRFVKVLLGIDIPQRMDCILNPLVLNVVESYEDR